MTDDPRDKFRRLINSEDETHAEPPSQPIPPPDSVPHQSYPAIDKDNMPLPRRVTETDMDGTRVTSAAYQTRTHPHRRDPPRPPSASPPAYRFSIRDLRLSTGGSSGSRWRRRILTALIAVIFLFVFIMLC